MSALHDAVEIRATTKIFSSKTSYLAYVQATHAFNCDPDKGEAGAGSGILVTTSQNRWNRCMTDLDRSAHTSAGKAHNFNGSQLCYCQALFFGHAAAGWGGRPVHSGCAAGTSAWCECVLLIGG